MAFNFGQKRREQGESTDNNYMDDNNSNYQNFSNIPQGSYADGNPYIDYTEEKEKNLIKLQIDMTESLDETSHWLNGDTPFIDKNGKKQWKTNTDEALRTLNESGVKEVMRILNAYLTKDNILSNLSEEKINNISKDIANEINDLFFTKYDTMGLDTLNKKKNCSSIVLTIAHRIYITLMRAKDGLERESITNNNVVNQNDGSLAMLRDNPGMIGSVMNRIRGGGR